MINSLDEAIKHCEEVVEAKEREAEYRQETQGDMFKFFDDLSKSVGGEGVENDALNECLECAKEHRQLAEWLRELKAYRNSPVLQRWLKQCDTCKHESKRASEAPCKSCCHTFKNKHEEVNADDNN